MKFVEGGVCAAEGFLAAGVYAGIKKNPMSRDLALIFSEVPAVAAGVFTSNKVKAACIAVSRQHLKNNRAQAIIVNSGNANCATGPQGLHDAAQTAQVAARSLGIKPDDVLVASTGVIGKPLPMEKIINAMPHLAKRLGIKNSEEAARAIMTTDTVKKELAVRFKLQGKNITIGGIAKGSGMISPGLATMLCFITTDASIAPLALKQALKNCVTRSFNCISVDGDMSTNDAVLILANGASGAGQITIAKEDAFEKFTSALFEITKGLARMIVKDGEGATKLIEVNVAGAKDPTDARLAAKAVCNSPLVKTAIYGEDANWGRIASAVGASGSKVDINSLSVYFGNCKVLNNGRPAGEDEKALKGVLAQKEIKITVDLGMGDSAATMWTCDFSEGYIRINAKYGT